MSDNSVVEFYNEYLERQVEAGIHHRHLYIQRWLEKFGFSEDNSVLEIGCGIGTQTQVMLQYLSEDAKVTSVDISDESIAIAKKRLAKYSNLTLIAGDITELEISEKFDVIVLPDVIEHIPLDLHDGLFNKLSKLLNPDGFILIHIPDPEYLQWVHENRPEELQVIDNPVHTNELLSKVYKYDLVIHYLKSYSIFNTPADYQVIVLKLNKSKDYKYLENPKNDSFLRRLKRKMKFVVRGK